MQKKITTILFDLDGTLIDTNELIVDSFLHTLGNYFPGEYKREDVFQFMGPSLQDTFTQLNPSKVDEMIAAYREHNHKRHDELVTIFPGVYETVETLYEQGYKLAIVSTKLSDTVHKGLKLTKLDRFFDVIVGFDHVTHAKPDPEPLLKALKQLDSTPEEAIMVGDNYHDILGGKNTGTLTCGVAWSLKGKEHLATFEPDYMLENMRDLLNILGVKENAKN